MIVAFCDDNSKRNRSRNTKLDYIVVYENSYRVRFRASSDQGQGHCRHSMFSLLPQNKLSGPMVQLWYKLGTLY